MTDMSITLLTGSLGLVALSIVSLAALRGWAQWISLRRFELDRMTAMAGGGDAPTDRLPHAGNRIEMADLRERVRKLEAIAAGVDL